MTDLVVVGVDGSRSAEGALRWAAAEARTRHARLRVVRAWTFLDQPEGSFDPSYGDADAQRQLDDAVAGLGADAEGIDIERLAVCDLPARGLLAAAAGADLLVVGARGLGGFQGLLLGSVSQQVANHAPCPVVIVPGHHRGDAPE